MALDYSARYGLAEGFQRTFDGKNPCPLCKQIAKARETEKESRAAVTLAPAKLVYVAAVAAESPSPDLQRHRNRYFVVPGSCSARTDRPAIPPPRTLAV